MWQKKQLRQHSSSITHPEKTSKTSDFKFSTTPAAVVAAVAAASVFSRILTTEMILSRLTQRHKKNGADEQQTGQLCMTK